MKAFTGEQLKKIELAFKRSRLSRRFLAATGAVAIMVPVVGCGESGDRISSDRAKEPGNTPAHSGGRPEENPIDRAGLKPTPTPSSEKPEEDSPSDNFELPATSHIGVNAGVKKDDLEAAGYDGDVDDLPVLGSTVDKQGLEDICQEEAKENVENIEKAKQGDTEAAANAGYTAVVDFFNEDGDYSKYTCLATETNS